ncbi:hypothetical protein [Niabella hibiscisoli]|uniref:hypothetical protein n=1 Tax=Niabella hibiscisoli TaxID=1825928 RepID=UPI001F0E4510|nr:hypothetical protein [Niabella hibiscisoli]MCH5718257.1 hypothetical protein [Niabella hibiscisoli]
MVNTYTYKRLVGMTRSIDFAGRTSFYDYDGFGRLKDIKDDGGAVVKHFDYKYADFLYHRIFNNFYVNMPVMRSHNMIVGGTVEVYNTQIEGGQYHGNILNSADDAARAAVNGMAVNQTVTPGPATAGLTRISFSGMYMPFLPNPSLVEVDLIQDGHVVYTVELPYNNYYSNPIAEFTLHIPEGIYRVSVRPVNNLFNYNYSLFIDYRRYDLDNSSFEYFKTGDFLNFEAGKSYSISAMFNS